MKLTRNTSGFTLVEIMIVVAIIGLLAAIAVPNFVQARTNARAGACVNNLRLIESAKEQIAIVGNLNTGDVVGASAAAALTAVGAYMKGGAAPTCPSAGVYAVGVVGTNATCTIGAPHTL